MRGTGYWADRTYGVWRQEGGQERDVGEGGRFVAAVNEYGERARCITDTQPTFRQLLGRERERRCFPSNGLRRHCQQCHLTMTVDEFVTRVHGMA